MDDKDVQPSGTRSSTAPGAPAAKTIDDLVLRELPDHAQRSSPKLRELVSGTILLNISDANKAYLLDWTASEFKATASDRKAAADCTITLQQDNLFRIAAGELNPQIAILSDKIRLEGRTSSALYLFNLIAPRPN